MSISTTETCLFPILYVIFTGLTKLVLNRDKAARLTFGFALAIIVYRWLTHSLVSQMQAPVLFEAAFDYTYWLYQFSGLPALLVKNHTGALIFDLLLLFSTLYCFALRAGQRGAVLLCAILWSVYGITYNSYVCHHTYAIAGIMVLPYAFLAKEEKNFRLVWDAFRYFCLYIYADAFFFKSVMAQNIFYFPDGVEFIKTNQDQFMLQNPGNWLTHVYAYFIVHPLLSYAGFLFMILLQGSMLLGFFTRKLDKYLFFVPILFHSITYFFIDVFFFELLVLNLTLLPFREAGPVSRFPSGKE